MLRTIRNKIVFGVLVLILCLQVVSALLQSYQIRAIFLNEFTQGAENVSHVVFLKLNDMSRTRIHSDLDSTTETVEDAIDLYMQIIQFEQFESLLRSKEDLVSLGFLNRRNRMIVNSTTSKTGVIHQNVRSENINGAPSELISIAQKRILSSFEADQYVYVVVPYLFQATYSGALILAYDNHQLRLAKLKMYLTSAALVLFYMGIASVLVFSLITRILTRPVRELTRLMTRLADGELNQWYPITSMDEIGEMGKSVNDLVKSLQTTFSNIRTAMDQPDSPVGHSRISTHPGKNINTLLDGLQTAEFELRLLSRKLIDTIEEERQKLAIDLHDDVGQALTSLQFDINLIEQSLTEDETERKDLCHEAMQKTKALTKTIRTTCARLRPELLDNLGLIPAIQSQVDEFNQQQKTVTIEFSTHPLYSPNAKHWPNAAHSMNAKQTRLHPHTELTLYRVFQESLNNALKHAHAKHVIISLAFDHAVVSLCIDDDGVGFAQDERGLPQDLTNTGIGLLSMKERVTALQGEITITSEKHHGTHIRVTFPIEEVSL